MACFVFLLLFRYDKAVLEYKGAKGVTNFEKHTYQQQG